MDEFIGQFEEFMVPFEASMNALLSVPSVEMLRQEQCTVITPYYLLNILSMLLLVFCEISVE